MIARLITELFKALCILFVLVVAFLFTTIVITAVFGVLGNLIFDFS